MDTICNYYTFKIFCLITIILLFIAIPCFQFFARKLLPYKIKDLHSEYATDLYVGLIVMFLGVVITWFVLVGAGDFNKRISSAFFVLCFGASINSCWKIRKTKILIGKARLLSTLGNRNNRIKNVNDINRLALTMTIFGFFGGFVGFLFIVPLSSYFPCFWFFAFLSSMVPILSFVLSSSSNTVIKMYAYDKKHGI